MKWVCQACGYVHEGDEPLEYCPVCKAPFEKDLNMDDEGSEYETNDKKNEERIDPNLVGNLQRNDLLQVLNEIKAITDKLDRCFDSIFNAKSQIEKANKEADSIRKARSGWVGIVDVVLLLIIFIFSFTLGENFYLMIILGIVFVVLIHKQLLAELDDTLFLAKKESKAKAYLDSIVPNNEEIIRKSQSEIQHISESDEGRWAIDIVGKELFNSEAIALLIDIVNSRRADTLKEALNKYDSMQHSLRMEQMQAAIQNASELTAEESAKQTAYAQQIEKNTHEAATAAKATAYHTRKIDRNVRKIKNNTR